MKKVIRFIPLIIIAIMLGGCPYESKVPIDPPSVKINPALLGRWSESEEEFIVTKVDDYIYSIKKKSKDSEEPTTYEAYLSNVDGEVFMNVKSGANTYYLYKFELNPAKTKVTLYPVTDYIDESFATSEELKAYISKHKGLSFFYTNDKAHYIKEE